MRTWEIAYRGLVPDAVIDGKTVEVREAKWSKILGGDDPVFVIERDGAVAGFLALMLPSRDDDATPTTAELAGLYVDPAHWRGGLASELFAAAVTWLAENGEWTELTLWALEQNERAHAFYVSEGFTTDGTRSQWNGLPDVRLRRTLEQGH